MLRERISGLMRLQCNKVNDDSILVLFVELIFGTSYHSTIPSSGTIINNSLTLIMLSKHKIIYIDDEPENLRAFKSVFRRVYNIFTTESPMQGIEYLRKNEVDLIITDQRMSEMTGVEFLEKIYKFMPGRPPCRIIYSGYSKTNDIEKAKGKKWMSFFVSKPCDPENLKNKIDAAIKGC